jgi:hypothetical protein
MLEGGRRGDWAEEDVELAEEPLPGVHEAIASGLGSEVGLGRALMVLPDEAEEIAEGLLVGGPLVTLRLRLGRIEPNGAVSRLQVRQGGMDGGALVAQSIGQGLDPLADRGGGGGAGDLRGAELQDERAD